MATHHQDPVRINLFCSKTGERRRCKVHKQQVSRHHHQAWIDKYRIANFLPKCFQLSQFKGIFLEQSMLRSKEQLIGLTIH